VKFLYRLVASGVAVWVATFLPGINLLPDPAWERILTVLGIAILFYVLTLGLIGLVVNGLLFWLTAWIAGRFGLPFQVTGFWPGFFGAIVVAVVDFILLLPLHIANLTRKAEGRR
jgi:putative membrane protein